VDVQRILKQEFGKARCPNLNTHTVNAFFDQLAKEIAPNF
jgi:hypothetical protein